jgi:hypothetical protein
VVIGQAVTAEGRDVRELNEQVQGWMETTVRGLTPQDTPDTSTW